MHTQHMMQPFELKQAGYEIYVDDGSFVIAKGEWSCSIRSTEGTFGEALKAWQEALRTATAHYQQEASK